MLSLCMADGMGGALGAEPEILATENTIKIMAADSIEFVTSGGSLSFADLKASKTTAENSKIGLFFLCIASSREWT